MIESKWRPSQERRNRDTANRYTYQNHQGNAVDGDQMINEDEVVNQEKDIANILSRLPRYNLPKSDVLHKDQAASSNAFTVNNSLKGYSEQSTTNTNVSALSSQPKSFLDSLLGKKNRTFVQKNINPNNNTDILNNAKDIQKYQTKLDQKVSAIQKEQAQLADETSRDKQMARLIEEGLKSDELYLPISLSRSNDLMQCQSAGMCSGELKSYPAEILSYYNSECDNVGMDEMEVSKGMLAVLGIAWISIGSRMYLWNISNDQLFSLQLSSHAIHIAYGTPKYLLFKQNLIEHVLVISTATQLIFKQLVLNPAISLQDIDTVISTDHEIVSQVMFSKKGRVFFGGSSGRVKCVDYFQTQLLGFQIKEGFEAKEGLRFFQKLFLRQVPMVFKQKQQVYSISIDETRQILYSLVQVGEPKNKIKRIDIYDLGAWDEQFNFVGSITQTNLANRIRNAVQSSSYSVPPVDDRLRIASMCVLERTTSPIAQLIIVTNSGVRAYISLKSTIAADKKTGKELSYQDCKEEREKNGLFERMRPSGQFQVEWVKGIIDSYQFNQISRNQHRFGYDPKESVLSKGNSLNVDENEVVDCFACGGDALMMRTQGNKSETSFLITISSNTQLAGRRRDNMFTKHSIFSNTPAAASSILPAETINYLLISSLNNPSNFNTSVASSINTAAKDNFQLSQFSVVSGITATSSLSSTTTTNSFFNLPQNLARFLQTDWWNTLEAQQLAGEQSGRGSACFMGELGRQCYFGVNACGMLSSRGIQLSYNLRPIDYLLQVLRAMPKEILLQNAQESLTELFEEFVISYGFIETTAMLIHLLSNASQVFLQSLEVHDQLIHQLGNKLRTDSKTVLPCFYLETEFAQAKQQQQQQAPTKNTIVKLPELISIQASQLTLNKAAFFLQKYGDVIVENEEQQSQQAKEEMMKQQMQEQQPQSLLFSQTYPMLNNSPTLAFSSNKTNNANSAAVVGTTQAQLENTLGKTWEWRRSRYSAKTEGMLLYFARLLRPIWGRSVFDLQASNNNNINNSVNSTSSLSFEEIKPFSMRLQEYLFWLKQETAVTSEAAQFIRVDQINEEWTVPHSIIAFGDKVSDLVNLIAFIRENKVRISQSKSNEIFSAIADEMDHVRFFHFFQHPSHIATLKYYILGTLQLDPAFIPKASSILSKYTGIFGPKDFELAGVEAKLRELRTAKLRNTQRIMIINQCVGILVNLAEHITKDLLDRLERLFAALDSYVDYARILIEIIAVTFKLQEASNSNKLKRFYSKLFKIDQKGSAVFQIHENIDLLLIRLTKLLDQIIATTQQSSSSPSQLDLFLILISNFKIQAVHGAVIESLLRNKKRTEILNLNSPFTEQVLESFEKKRAECKNCLDCIYCLFYLDCLKIKFKYFDQLGNIREAYRVAFEISNFENKQELPSDMVLLSDRIDFTEIAIYDISLLLSDFNISHEEKQTCLQNREILQKQLKVLKVQKRIHDKLSLSLSFIQGNLKKIKDANQKKAIEEQKKNFQESSDLLSRIRLDEGRLEKYIIQNLNLVEFSLILHDLNPQNQQTGNIDKLYQQLIARMSSSDNFEAEPWPLNIQSTLSMLNSEITNKSLISLQTIIIQGETVNAERTWKEQWNLRQFLDLYSGILANRESAFANILNSPYWMPYFFINSLNYSPLSLVKIYCQIWKIFNLDKDVFRKDVLKGYIHLANCLMFLLKQSIQYINQVLLNHQMKPSEIFILQQSIQTIERTLNQFNSDFLNQVKKVASNESEAIQYQQYFERVQEELLEQFSQIQQLGSDLQIRERQVNCIDDSASISGESMISGAKNSQFSFGQEYRNQMQYSSQLQSSLKSNPFNFISDADTIVFNSQKQQDQQQNQLIKQQQSQQNFQRGSLESKENKATYMTSNSETLTNTRYYQIKELDNEEEEEEIVILNKKRV